MRAAYAVGIGMSNHCIAHRAVYAGLFFLNNIPDSMCSYAQQKINNVDGVGDGQRDNNRDKKICLRPFVTGKPGKN